jgi:hypothetical protein
MFRLGLPKGGEAEIPALSIKQYRQVSLSARQTARRLARGQLFRHDSPAYFYSSRCDKWKRHLDSVWNSFIEQEEIRTLNFD